jgi:hypothetical protein
MPKGSYRDGRQCAYIPNHVTTTIFEEALKHPDVEFGFLYGNGQGANFRNSLSVRYFAKFSFPIRETDELPDLRTKANGERTDISNLFFIDSLPQDYVDEWVDTLDRGGG